jgi:hypothetical protein
MWPGKREFWVCGGETKRCSTAENYSQHTWKILVVKKKPQAITAYDDIMGGIDFVDQHYTVLPCHHIKMQKDIPQKYAFIS